MLMERSGEIVFGDQGVPQFYDHDTTCEWVVLPIRDATKRNELDISNRFEVIELTFSRVDLGIGDTLRVFDGPSAGEGAKPPILSMQGSGFGVREHTFGYIGNSDSTNIHGENGFARSESGIMTVQLVTDHAPLECSNEGNLVLQVSMPFYTSLYPPPSIPSLYPPPSPPLSLSLYLLSAVGR
jgi:hypothetical protein